MANYKEEKLVSSENQTVRDIILPLSAFPCLQENSKVREAIQQLRSFCPIGSRGPCGFSELMVVDEQPGGRDQTLRGLRRPRG